ncbi:MAG TPA: YkgJ family cysteine cluster protein [Polyangiaceae bacterium]|nr:YkgJ family cysteine cluster protein [Polyangiaceae bacterium]
MAPHEARRRLRVLREGVAARVADTLAARPWWPCRRGCDLCCRRLARPLAISAAEWGDLAEGLAALPPAERATALARARGLARDEAAGALEGAHVRCPFLDEAEGACSLYEHRPLACRTYGFYVARDHDQHCDLVTREVEERGDDLIWGNADALRVAAEGALGEPLPFAEGLRRLEAALARSGGPAGTT